MLVQIMLASSFATAAGFYLPGVAPHSFAKDEVVELKVNKLRWIDYYWMNPSDFIDAKTSRCRMEFPWLILPWSCYLLEYAILVRETLSTFHMDEKNRLQMFQSVIHDWFSQYLIASSFLQNRFTVLFTPSCPLITILWSSVRPPVCIDKK